MVIFIVLSIFLAFSHYNSFFGIFCIIIVFLVIFIFFRIVYYTTINTYHSQMGKALAFSLLILRFTLNHNDIPVSCSFLISAVSPSYCIHGSDIHTFLRQIDRRTVGKKKKKERVNQTDILVLTSF